MWSALVWVIMRRIVIIPIRRFRATCRSYLQEIVISWPLKMEVTATRYVITQKIPSTSRRKPGITQHLTYLHYWLCKFHLSAVWLYVDWYVGTDVLEGLFAAIFKVTQKDWYRYTNLFFQGATALWEPGPLRCRGFTFTLRHTTLSRTPLDGWSARRRDLYLTTHNTHKRQSSMPPEGFEPAIPASKRQKIHVLDRAGVG